MNDSNIVIRLETPDGFSEVERLTFAASFEFHT
jgi:hypothetical protein